MCLSPYKDIFGVKIFIYISVFTKYSHLIWNDYALNMDDQYSLDFYTDLNLVNGC